METITNTATALQQLFEAQGLHRQQLADESARERIDRLKKIERYLHDQNNVDRLIEALRKDFRKAEEETWISEVWVVLQQIRHVKKNLRRWMAPHKVATPLPLIGTSSHIRHEPKGRCLIFAPWNYPFNLSFLPVISAIAAGNAIVLKPSEISANTSRYIKTMVESLFPPEEFAVVEGGVETATQLLDLPFDHIFFTGSPKVGRIVMAAAARHLSSVTLELGGKSPAIIDGTTAIKDTALKAAWGKCFNVGQTCIAPDYLLVKESVKEPFITAYREAIDKLYPSGQRPIHDNPDYGRVISDQHFHRLKRLLDDALDKGAKVEAGGQVNAADRFIAPTLLSDVTPEMAIMQEEIFGPIMPLMTFRTTEEAADIIARQPKPLTMYIASKDRKAQKYWLQHTSAGGTVINEYLLSYANPNLPFGGINNSGMGKSLGFKGFVEFSNERGVMQRHWGTMSMLFPPYTGWKNKMVQFMARWL